jgi:hypothetical protein
MMGYIEKHSDWGIVLRVDLDASWDSKKAEVFVDSDHGGDWRNGKSTGGCVGLVRDDGHTNAAITSWSKLQEAPAENTAEAEYAAMARAIKTTAYPMQMMMNEIMEHEEAKLEVLIDNKAAEAIAKSGQSRRLKYMAKHHRVRTSFVKFFVENKNGDVHKVVKRVETDKNLADPFTKSLGKEKHFQHFGEMGMMSRGDFDASGNQ